MKIFDFIKNFSEKVLKKYYTTFISTTASFSQKYKHHLSTILGSKYFQTVQISNDLFLSLYMISSPRKEQICLLNKTGPNSHKMTRNQSFLRLNNLLKRLYEILDTHIDGIYKHQLSTIRGSKLHKNKHHRASNEIYWCL